MNKIEALKAARQHIGELLAEKNDRGYAIVTMTANDRLDAELRFARWLMEDED